MCRHTNYPSPGPHTGTLQWLKLLQHAAFSVMKHEPRSARLSRGRSLQRSNPAPAAPSRKLCLTFPSWSLCLGAACHQDRDQESWHPRPAPCVPIPLLQVPSASLETPEHGMGEGQQNGFGFVGVFFARTLIRWGNQRLKVTYTAIASHAEPNIHRRKYCINYNAEQHSISAIVPLQL